MGYPTEEQVELGVVYGAEDELTGTLDITADNPVIPDPPVIGSVASFPGPNLKTNRITMTGDGVIRYTLDGTDPSNGTIYKTPLIFKSPVTIRAVCILDGHQSDVAVAVVN